MPAPEPSRAGVLRRAIAGQRRDLTLGSLLFMAHQAAEALVPVVVGLVIDEAVAHALPDGLDTVIGHGGHRINTTQAQQLALARIILADPPIAVLDEATAEAGSAGARTLETAAAEALEGRTALIVAHRLSQAVAADRIVVLDAGACARPAPTTSSSPPEDRTPSSGPAWASSRADDADVIRARRRAPRAIDA